MDTLENMRGKSTRDHVMTEAVAREIVHRFKVFLQNFKGPNERKIFVDKVSIFQAVGWGEWEKFQEAGLLT